MPARADALAPDAEFPDVYARTRRFSLGRPRSFRVAPDGARVAFLRSRSGTDPVTCLWVLDLATGEERLVVDPAELAGDGVEPSVEAARRERARELATGIVAYATDHDCRRACFELSGRLFTVDLHTGAVSPVAGAAPDAVQPRLDPTGTRLAYVADGALHVRTGDEDRVLCADDDPDVTWGLAEFVAAEEMGRSDGYWWAPDGTALLVARVDVGPVQRWYLGDPAHPATPPRPLRYPAAGTANADVTLHLCQPDGSRVAVEWDRDRFPYLVAVRWSRSGPPLVTLQTRDQRHTLLTALHPPDGLRVLSDDLDPTWTEPVEGLPAWLDDGRLVHWRDVDGCCRLLVDDVPVSPPGWQLRGVAAVDGDAVVFTATEEPTERHVWRWSATDGPRRLTDVPGVHHASDGGPVHVLTSASLAEATRYRVVGAAVDRQVRSVAVAAASPRPRLLTLAGGLRAGLVLPADVGAGPLPVLLCPYGGPGAQQVLASRDVWPVPGWFADQGFAVLVVDGRGTPGRDHDWTRAVAGDLAGPVLADQVAALHAAAEVEPRLDLTRVGIRGASFGGYLSLLAVLRRPEVFHAAAAFAPVTDWHWYDTHYTERYLGDPTVDDEPYRRCSLLDEAAGLSRPLLVMHGLEDDNVLPVHTVALSARLVEAGRAHELRLLPGASHGRSQDAVTANLLRLERDFFSRCLAVAGS